MIGTARRQGLKEGFERGEKEGFEKGEKKGFEKGEKKGFEKGEKKGFEKGRIEVLYKLINGGSSEPFIISLGYTEEEYKEAISGSVS